MKPSTFAYKKLHLLSNTKLYTIISQHLAVSLDRVTDNANFKDDLGADSLDIVDKNAQHSLLQLMIWLEDEFDCSLSDDDTDTIQTVRDLASAMRRGLPLSSPR